jgi:hypothetical protein
LVNRSHALLSLAVAAAIALSGTLIYLIRAQKLGQWPFKHSGGISYTNLSSDIEYSSRLLKDPREGGHGT